MAEINNPRLTGTGQQRGHEYVTGRTAFQPAAATEAHREEGAISAGTHEVIAAVESAWDSAISCMRRYPVAAFLTGIGLGFVLAWELERR